MCFLTVVIQIVLFFLFNKLIKCELCCLVNDALSFTFLFSSWSILKMLSVYTLVYKKTLYSRIILPICGVPAETCSFLVFPLLVHLSCVTVYCSGCPAAHGGVWLGSWFLRLLGRHPLWLPAWLMSPCLVFGVILNYCGTEFPMSLRVCSPVLTGVYRYSEICVSLPDSLFCLFFNWSWKSETVVWDSFKGDYSPKNVLLPLVCIPLLPSYRNVKSLPLNTPMVSIVLLLHH